MTARKQESSIISALTSPFKYAAGFIFGQDSKTPERGASDGCAADTAVGEPDCPVRGRMLSFEQHHVVEAGPSSVPAAGPLSMPEGPSSLEGQDPLAGFNQGATTNPPAARAMRINTNNTGVLSTLEASPMHTVLPSVTPFSEFWESLKQQPHHLRGHLEVPGNSLGPTRKEPVSTSRYHPYGNGGGRNPRLRSRPLGTPMQLPWTKSPRAAPRNIPPPSPRLSPAPLLMTAPMPLPTMTPLARAPSPEHTTNGQGRVIAAPTPLRSPRAASGTPPPWTPMRHTPIPVPKKYNPISVPSPSMRKRSVHDTVATPNAAVRGLTGLETLRTSIPKKPRLDVTSSLESASLPSPLAAPVPTDVAERVMNVLGVTQPPPVSPLKDLPTRPPPLARLNSVEATPRKNSLWAAPPPPKEVASPQVTPHTAPPSKGLAGATSPWQLNPSTPATGKAQGDGSPAPSLLLTPVSGLVTTPVLGGLSSVTGAATARARTGGVDAVCTGLTFATTGWRGNAEARTPVTPDPLPHTPTPIPKRTLEFANGPEAETAPSSTVHTQPSSDSKLKVTFRFGRVRDSTTDKAVQKIMSTATMNGVKVPVFKFGRKESCAADVNAGQKRSDKLEVKASTPMLFSAEAILSKVQEAAVVPLPSDSDEEGEDEEEVVVLDEDIGQGQDDSSPVQAPPGHNKESPAQNQGLTSVPMAIGSADKGRDKGQVEVAPISAFKFTAGSVPTSSAPAFGVLQAHTEAPQVSSPSPATLAVAPTSVAFPALSNGSLPAAKGMASLPVPVQSFGVVSTSAVLGFKEDKVSPPKKDQAEEGAKDEPTRSSFSPTTQGHQDPALKPLSGGVPKGLSPILTPPPSLDTPTPPAAASTLAPFSFAGGKSKTSASAQAEAEAPVTTSPSPAPFSFTPVPQANAQDKPTPSESIFKFTTTPPPASQQTTTPAGNPAADSRPEGQPALLFSFTTQASAPLSSSANTTSTTPSFAFGSAATSAPAPSFGGFGSSATTSAPTFTFGGQGASNPSAGPNFQFGAQKSSAPLPAPSQPPASLSPSPAAASPWTAQSSGPSAAQFTFGASAVGNSTSASTSSSNPFGSGPPTSGMPSSASPSGGLFGTPAPTTSLPSPAPSPSVSVFGATAAPTFGAQSSEPTRAFGAAPSIPAPTFGAPSSGPALAFGAAPSGPTTPFGSTPSGPGPTFNSAPSFGTGASGPAPTFGAVAPGPAPAFGTAAPGPAPTFGATTPGPAPTFGAAAPAVPAGSIFGQSNPTPAPTFGAVASETPAWGMFGSTAPQNPVGAAPPNPFSPAPTAAGFGGFNSGSFGMGSGMANGPAPPGGEGTGMFSIGTTTENNNRTGRARIKARRHR